jgi:fatty-acyl-CoA synthase
MTRPISSTRPAASAKAYRRQDPGPVPAQELFYHDLLSAAVLSAAEREALVFCPGDAAPELRLTYLELDVAVTEVARALLANGVTRGGVVAVYGTNRPEFVMLQFACSQIGAAVAPINPQFEPTELAYVLARAGTEICFVAPDHRGLDLWERLAALAGEIPTLRLRVPFERRVDQALDWQEWLASAQTVDDRQLATARAATNCRDTVQIQFTSGTTGRPKAVELNGYGLANGGRCIAHRAGLGDGCRYLHAMPFFHVGGTVTAMSTLMAVAGTHIFLPAFNPKTMSAVIEHEQPDTILAVPTMMISLADYADAHGVQLASLTTVVTGGALVPETVAARWIDGYGVGISNTYGLTELSGPAVATAPDDPRDRALTTCGRPLPGVEVEIVTPGTTDRLDLDAEGEIRFRGWGLMNGYLNDPDATASVVDDDGWFRSGDLGKLGAEGFVQVTGRAKDVIIRGGENISPAAVEDAIREHVPSVVDVSVVGVPDDYYGESVAAFVTLHSGSTLTQPELAQLLAGKLAAFRVPAHLRILDALPTTASGKVQKFRLVAMFTSEPAPPSSR